MKFDDPKEFAKLKSYEIVFNNHYAIWLCRDEKHALERARETYKQKTVLSVREL